MDVTFPVTDQRLHAGVEFPQLDVQILKMLLLLLEPLTSRQEVRHTDRKSNRKSDRKS